MRNTKQRELILKIVNSSSKHLTAVLIYNECLKYIPNISLGTIYRNLNYLVDINKLKRISMPNGIDRFDKNFIHSHIICKKCGRIEDYFEMSNIDLPVIDNYEVIDYDLCFNGICSKCQKEEK